ncbi:MAG TPA: HIT domain-containing protein [Verrucomicrobiota bacterium]|nr:HIT domain-containing protein [Verrucomicrobiota bacterium]
MKPLHAPWRIHYILGPKPTLSDKSIFSRAAEMDDDEKNYIIARRKACFAVLNTYPYNGGHMMVVPYRQVSNFEDLSDVELLDMMQLVQTCQKALNKLMKPDGFNIGINQGKVAGAGIAEHLHIHIVPRWSGDTNFMPVMAEISVLPQALTELAANLRGTIKNMDAAPN